jgi:phenylalanine-4-hydroxylase
MRVKRAIDRLPDHLKPYVVDQPKDLYTPIDHAVWRYIMRLSKDFFKDHAHEKYLDGLVETGIESEFIPEIDAMDLCLSQFGWGAVPVCGFIPPAVFMELLSHGILPIAAEIRKIENIEYTPSPDIVHEAAGHAPIVADPEYAQFLHDCGEIARKCIITKKDMEQYEAILALSNLKEDPRSTEEQIAAAEERVRTAAAANKVPSEATQFGRMMWWTVEYGLVGPMDAPKIYGAGLLSSIGESFRCLGPEVKKIPFTVDCVNYSYDITEPQPQLFVTPDFPTLSRVAKEFAQMLSYKLGGRVGLDRAVDAAYPTTTELDTGIQISGVLAKYRANSHGEAVYLHYVGPCQLAYADSELPGQGVERHAHGFGTPLGRFIKQELPEGRTLLKFDSGVQVAGRLKSETSRDGKTILMTFADCKVTLADEVLFQPEWGEFDMACGHRVRSVFGGAADRPKYVTGEYEKYRSRKPVPNVTAENQRLFPYYEKVRAWREGRLAFKADDLEKMILDLETVFKNEWLLTMELLELAHSKPVPAEVILRLEKRLEKIKLLNSDLSTVIDRGLRLLQQ